MCAADALLVLIFSNSFHSLAGNHPASQLQPYSNSFTFPSTHFERPQRPDLPPFFFSCFLLSPPRLSFLSFPFLQNQNQKCLTPSRTPRGRRSTRPSSLPVSVFYARARRSPESIAAGSRVTRSYSYRPSACEDIY